MVSIMWTKRSPGVISATRTSQSVAFHQSCDTPASITATSPSRDARTPVARHGQLALDCCESLDKSGMVVLAHNARPDDSGQFGGRAARRLRPGKLKNFASLTSESVHSDLANHDRSEVRRPVRVGVSQALLLEGR